MPTSSQTAHIDGPLSNLSLAFMQDLTQFVGSTAFPTINVAKQSDRYHVFDLEAFLTARAKERDEGTEAAEGGFGLSQDTYFARSIAVKFPITDELRSNADDSLEMEQSAVEGVTYDIMQTQEFRLANAAFVDNVWYNGMASAQAADGSKNWADSAGDPIGDVATARRAITGRTGIRPNRLLVGERAWDSLKSNEKIVELISGGATTGAPALATRELVARALDLESVSVAGGVAQLEGGSGPGFVIDDKALLYYAPSSGGRRIATAATRFVWGGPRNAGTGGPAIRSYREENRSRDVVEGQLFVDYKITAPQLGFLWDEVSQ